MRRKGATAVLGCIVIAAGIVAPALAGTRTTANFTLDTKLGLKKVRLSSGPQEIRILTLAPGAVPDIAPATQQYPMWALTSTMSANAGAIAGVNGDFGTGRGQPVHTLMIDGELWTTGQAQGRAVAWSSDGSRAYIGHPALRIKATGSTGALFNIQEWNAHAPTATSIAAYTSRGGSTTTPPGKTNPTSTDPKWCAARLVPSHAIEWSGCGADVARPQVHGGGAARALPADAAGCGLQCRAPSSSHRSSPRPWPTRCRRSPPVTP